MFVSKTYLMCPLPLRITHLPKYTQILLTNVACHQNCKECSATDQTCKSMKIRPVMGGISQCHVRYYSVSYILSLPKGKQTPNYGSRQLRISKYAVYPAAIHACSISNFLHLNNIFFIIPSTFFLSTLPTKFFQ